MLNNTRIIYFNKIFMYVALKTISNIYYCYNEDTSNIQNFYLNDWEVVSNQWEKNITINVGLNLEKDTRRQLKFSYELFQIAAEMKNLQHKNISLNDRRSCVLSIWENRSDICLDDVTDRTTEDTILPFLTVDYAIYYKIKEFHVSSTFFIDGMSHDLWMFSFITLGLIFVGFLITSKVYCYYLKKPWFISDVFIYQSNFWCNQTVLDHLDRFLPWRIQLINGFMFNIIIMTAFSAKFVELMSIRHFEQPFNNLEDFAAMRTHSLCVSSALATITYFHQNRDVHAGRLPKWKGILNPPACDNVIPRFHGSICKLNDIAVIFPAHQYKSKRIKCPIYELSGLIPSAYRTFVVSKGFKEKENLNQAYLKMREVGIVDRVSKQTGMKKDPLINFQDHYSDKYKVHEEGVMFDHVKFIVFGYFIFLPIPIIILIIEIMIHKHKMQMLKIINRFSKNVSTFPSF